MAFMTKDTLPIRVVNMMKELRLEKRQVSLISPVDSAVTSAQSMFPSIGQLIITAYALIGNVLLEKPTWQDIIDLIEGKETSKGTSLYATQLLTNPSLDKVFLDCYKMLQTYYSVAPTECKVLDGILPAEHVFESFGIRVNKEMASLCAMYLKLRIANVPM